ncbi:DUF4391 domain-containing protein [Marinobacter sp. AC-23]|uniref:DUF4391 domain-containing protein n=1 Tax=Marinobacter sp. AC-23 TaxID=1879031 RepID=UPI0008DE1CF0|nr:DUF4391 domain-containing protein [Marinobacter sp. AC-23]OHY79687.1 methyl-accepting chemotaxis protein [Marinobacter sp. AC-23]
MTLFAWPKAAAFGRVIPKSKIYEHASASSALKERFVQQVEQIIWAYKLAPETVNLPATATVTEIQIVRVTLKGSSLDQDLLKAIDRAIPFPLIFELINNGRTKLAAAYKRPSDSDAHRWVVGNYFETDWLAEQTPRHPLPMALDMAALYERLLSPLVDARLAYPAPATATGFPEVKDAASTPADHADESERLSLEQRIALADTLAAQHKEIERIQSRLRREKQFNKRVAINAELREARQTLKRLTQQQVASASY